MRAKTRLTGDFFALMIPNRNNVKRIIELKRGGILYVFIPSLKGERFLPAVIYFLLFTINSVRDMRASL